MRLIDADEIRKSIHESIDECVEWADEVEESEMYARVSQSIGTFVECSLRIKNAPTVDVLDKIRAEIQKVLDAERDFTSDNAKAQAIALSWCLEIIDRYTKGAEE